jgi:hypothetical protein
MCLTNVKRADDRTTRHFHATAASTFLAGVSATSTTEAKLQALEKAVLAFGVWRRLGSVNATRATSGCTWTTFTADDIRNVVDAATLIWKGEEYARGSGAASADIALTAPRRSMMQVCTTSLAQTCC